MDPLATGTTVKGPVRKPIYTHNTQHTHKMIPTGQQTFKFGLNCSFRRFITKYLEGID